ERSRFIQAFDRVVDDLEFSPKSTSPHFELFNAAFTGKFNNFKWLALGYAKGEEIGVADAIGKITDGKGRGSLHFAAFGGSLNVCKYLHETLKLDVDVKDKNGHTPLYLATVKGCLDTVMYLLEKGANADASDHTNHTPLHCAAKIVIIGKYCDCIKNFTYLGDLKIMTLLLSRGVRVDVPSGSGTALLVAACTGHQDAVKLLLNHGANPNFASGHGGMFRPLMSTIFSKSWGSLELLLQ
ncbi:hypothetical protein MKW94_024312, partial [Papaver nudicaule]|nr:hypothetical protein [Papaver nudicaule]